MQKKCFRMCTGCQHIVLETMDCEALKVGFDLCSLITQTTAETGRLSLTGRIEVRSKLQELFQECNLDVKLQELFQECNLDAKFLDKSSSAVCLNPTAL